MSHTVMLADDDAAIRMVLNQALTRAGYDVRITSNAATLWRWISAGEGDLVVTDVIMPDENAFDLLPRIKKARPDLPVLVMSAQNTFMTAIRASRMPSAGVASLFTSAVERTDKDAGVMEYRECVIACRR